MPPIAWPPVIASTVGGRILAAATSGDGRAGRRGGRADAIIDSIRAETADNHLGFRLVFTLSTNDWDSG